MLSRQDEREAWSSKQSFLLLGLLLAGLAVRMPHLMAPYVINPDAIDYINSAKALALGRWSEGFKASHVSIFPVLIALVQPISGDWLGTARGISVFFGLLTVIPLYLVARKLLEGFWALIPPLLYCLSPSLTHYSMDVIREPLSWFFVMVSLWALLRARESSRAVWFLLAGVTLLVGIANRLDGLVALGVGLAWLLGVGILRRQLFRAVREMGLLMLPSLVAFSAAMLFHEGGFREHGLWEIKAYQRQIRFSLAGPDQAQNSKIENILGNIPQRRLRNFFSSAWENRRALAAVELVEHWIRAAHPALWGLGLVGLMALGKWRSRESWWLVGLLWGAWLVLGYVRVSGAFAISRRHLGPAVLSGYLFAALGFFQVSLWAANKGLLRLSKALPGLLLCALVLLTLPWTLSPRRQDKLVRRLAGEWIRSQGIPNPLVATEHQIVAFYSEGSWIPLKDFLQGSPVRPDFLVVEKEGVIVEKVAEGLKQAEIDSHLLREVQHPGNPTLLVYRLKASPISPGLSGSMGRGGSNSESFRKTER